MQAPLNTELRYLYRQNLTGLILAILLFGLGAWFFFYKGSENDRGLIINGIIELSPANATIFYYVLGILSFAFVLAGLISIFFYFKEKKYLIINQNEMIIPAAGFMKGLQVSFDKPFSVQETKINRQYMLTVKSEGKSTTIMRSFLKKEQYEEIKNILFKILDN